MMRSPYLFSTKELDEVIKQLLPEGAHIQIDSMSWARLAIEHV